MTDTELQKLLEYWQGELRLRDWDITVRIVRVHEMQGTGHRGNCRWAPEDKSATIKILVQDDYRTDSFVLHDMEQTLVHELLHLHTFRFAPDRDCMDEEIALNMIASALVRLKRNTLHKSGENHS